MNVALMGPPGSGKGTQATRLAAATGYEHLSTGAMLRSEIEMGTDLGGNVAGLVSAGALVPDDLIIELVGPRALVASERGGYILDGYPRSIQQAEAVLASPAPPDLVIAIEVPDSVLIGRILARAAIEGRADDTPEIVALRLRVFEETTRPVLELFATRGLLQTVDADSAPDLVAAAILDAVHRRLRAQD